MSDLISRSKVIAILEQLEEHSLSGKMDISNAIYLLENQPTAYNIGKVVAELEQKKEEVQRMRNTCVALSDLEVCDIENVTYKRAIEIIKHGGVSDDVCEWKYTKEIMDNAEFKVGCNQNALKRGIVPNNFSYHDFKYCPYCGKKIKVMQ